MGRLSKKKASECPGGGCWYKVQPPPGSEKSLPILVEAGGGFKSGGGGGGGGFASIAGTLRVADSAFFCAAKDRFQRLTVGGWVGGCMGGSSVHPPR